jgi:multiple sugar transport system permease protein
LRSAVATTGKRKRRGVSIRSRFTPYVYLAPHAVFFSVFVLLPLFLGFYISLHKWGLYSGNPEFVGFRYYARLFDFDFIRTGYYWRSVWATLQFVVFSVPPLVALGLGLALLINSDDLKEWQRRLFRTVFLLPVAMAVTVIAVVWRWLLLYDSGLINYLLGMAGMSGVPWLTEQPGAWISIVLATVWWTAGWNMIILLVGLQGIPRTIYEAAVIDGASRIQTLFFVTLPNLKGVLLFVLVIQIIASFNLFAQPQLMTAGGPDRTTLPVMMQIYTDAFSTIHPRVGSSCAMGFMTGAIMLVFLLVQFRLFLRKAD